MGGYGGGYDGPYWSGNNKPKKEKKPMSDKSKGFARTYVIVFITLVLILGAGYGIKKAVDNWPGPCDRITGEDDQRVAWGPYEQGQGLKWNNKDGKMAGWSWTFDGPMTKDVCLETRGK